MPSLEAQRSAPLFIGDHLAMDFLNTAAAPWGEPIEWLGSGSDLVDWLEQAGAIEGSVATRFREEPGARRGLDRVGEQARGLREWLRGLVEEHAGKTLGPDAAGDLGPLNRLLARDDSYGQIEAVGKRRGADEPGPAKTLRWRQARRWSGPDQLLQPIAKAIGELVCDADFRHIHQCESAGCTLMFYDRSKSHARRWCSMAVCGNRAKAAAHRAKHRRRREASAKRHAGSRSAG